MTCHICLYSEYHMFECRFMGVQWLFFPTSLDLNGPCQVAKEDRHFCLAVGDFSPFLTMSEALAMSFMTTFTQTSLRCRVI